MHCVGFGRVGMRSVGLHCVGFGCDHFPRGAWHHEPPDVAWLPPELEIGVEPELKPLEPELADDEPELELELELEPELELELLEELEPAELEPVELEPVELEPELEEPEPEPVELEPVEDEPAEVEPVEGEVEPVEDEAVLCVDPGRARASAPAVTTLAMVTAVVVDRTLSRPRSLAAIARRIPSRSALLM